MFEQDAIIYCYYFNFELTFQDFHNADPNCPGYVVSAFEMIEKLSNQGPKGVHTW